MLYDFPIVAGFVAGLTITASSVPKTLGRVRALKRREIRFSREDLIRDLLQGIGNAIWFAVGWYNLYWPLMIFALISTGLMLTLVCLNLRALVEQPRADGETVEV